MNLKFKGRFRQEKGSDEIESPQNRILFNSSSLCKISYVSSGLNFQRKGKRPTFLHQESSPVEVMRMVQVGSMVSSFYKFHEIKLN